MVAAVPAGAEARAGEAVPVGVEARVVGGVRVAVMAVDGPIGMGWSMNLTAHLYYAAYLYATPSTYQKEADVVLPNGARYRFVESADRTFSPPSFRYDTLTKNADGSFDLAIADG